MAPPLHRKGNPLSAEKKYTLASMAQGTLSREGRRTALGYITLRIYELMTRFISLLELVKNDKEFLETPEAHTPEMKEIELYLRKCDQKARGIINQAMDIQYVEKEAELTALYKQAEQVVSQYENGCLNAGFDYTMSPKPQFPRPEIVMKAVLDAVNAVKKVIIPPPALPQLTSAEINLLNPSEGSSPLLQPSINTLKHIMEKKTFPPPLTMMPTSDVVDAASILLRMSKSN